MKLPIDPTQDPMAATIAAKAKELQEKDAAAQNAAKVAMPGPLRNAFATAPEIEVGPYKVRPVYDLDVELLQEANHPFSKIISDLLTTGKASQDGYIGRGPQGWLAAWMFTEGVDSVEALWAERAAQSKAKFGKLQIAALVRIAEAITQQCIAYADTMIAYEPEQVGEKASGPPSQPKP